MDADWKIKRGGRHWAHGKQIEGNGQRIKHHEAYRKHQKSSIGGRKWNVKEATAREGTSRRKWTINLKKTAIGRGTPGRQWDINKTATGKGIPPIKWSVDLEKASTGKGSPIILHGQLDYGGIIMQAASQIICNVPQGSVAPISDQDTGPEGHNTLLGLWPIHASMWSQFSWGQSKANRVLLAQHGPSWYEPMGS